MGTLQNHLPFLFLNLQASSGEAKNKSALSLYFNVLAHCKGNLLSTVNSLSCNKSPIRLFENQRFIFHDLCALWNIGNQTTIAVAHCLQQTQGHSLQIRRQRVDVSVPQSP